jgi:hypothetical protein
VAFPGTELADAAFGYASGASCAALYAAARVEVVQAAMDGERGADGALQALADACAASRRGAAVTAALWEQRSQNARAPAGTRGDFSATNEAARRRR